MPGTCVIWCGNILFWDLETGVSGLRVTDIWGEVGKCILRDFLVGHHKRVIQYNLGLIMGLDRGK